MLSIFPPSISGVSISGEVSVLLVSVCVSDVPTIVPEGAVFPSTVSAFKFVTFVVEATANGAVPVVALNAEVESSVLLVSV